MSKDVDLYIMPINLDKFFSDPAVQQMDGAEIGAYFLMLAYNWKEGGIPNDEKLILKITRLVSHFERVPPLVLAQFRLKNGKLYNRKAGRVKREVLKRIKDKSIKTQAAANRRWKK